MQTEDRMSDSFLTTSEVCQGCIAAPNPFNVTVDNWLKSMMEHCPDLCVKYHFYFIDQCCADNVMLFTTLTDTLIEYLEAVSDKASPLGLTIRWAKTKVQFLPDFLPPSSKLINFNTEEFEVVNKFVYLGSKISCWTLRLTVTSN